MLLYDVLSQQGGTLSLNEGLFLPKRKTKREIAIPVSLKLLLMKKTFKKRHEEQSNWWKHIGSFVKLFVFLFLFLAILGIITMFSYFSWYIELYWMKSWWNPQRSPPFFLPQLFDTRSRYGVTLTLAGVFIFVLSSRTSTSNLLASPCSDRSNLSAWSGIVEDSKTEHRERSNAVKVEISNIPAELARFEHISIWSKSIMSKSKLIVSVFCISFFWTRVYLVPGPSPSQ